MVFTKDMKDFVEILKRNQVRHVLVGGFAVNYYGYVRTTQDIDILIFPSKKNAQKMMAALQEFGFGSAGIPQKCFEMEGSAVHMGAEPNRIDLLTRLKGVPNGEIFKKKKRVQYKKVFLNLISFDHLIKVKKHSNRLKDLADVDELLKLVPGKKKQTQKGTR
jgi:predicted nucleotidyltransferase